MLLLLLPQPVSAGVGVPGELKTLVNRIFRLKGAGMVLEVVTRLASPAHDLVTKPTGAKGARPAKSTFVYGSFANALRSALAGVGLTRLRTALTSVADKA